MKTAGHMPSHADAHDHLGDRHPAKQFWIAFTLVSMGALGVTALALAPVMAALTLFG